ncbi:MAG: hypothetical protein OSB21_08900, partial [Myxococcota bacterium]|nr:hypothetical protein [Myxococcota bacterium]
GTMVCTGFNEYGQLGDGLQSNQRVPVGVLATVDISAMASGVGSKSNLALGANNEVLAWGLNSDGQLGLDNETTPQLALSLVSGF